MIILYYYHLVKGWVRGLSYLTIILNTVGYNVTVRLLSQKLLFCHISLFLLHTSSRTTPLTRTQFRDLIPCLTCRTSITGSCPFSTYGIVVGCQYIVSYIISFIWICKHIKCWAYTVFTMCQTPSCVSDWCDNLALLPTQEVNPHLSTGPHLGASLSGRFDIILCLCHHSFDETYMRDQAIPGPWDIRHMTSEWSICLFLTVLIFSCYFSSICDGLLKGSLQVEIDFFSFHFYHPTLAVFCYLVVNVY